MASANDLDDELARFEAELQALEQQQPVATSDNPTAIASTITTTTKRARDDSNGTTTTTSEEPARKRVDTGASNNASVPPTTGSQTQTSATTSLARPVVTETVEIRAAPTIYTAPPRPAPIKKPLLPVSPQAPLRLPGVANTVDEVFARRGALSGFPAGFTGERASTAGMYQPKPPQAPLVPRYDPVTGAYVSTEEQQLLLRQQSVYAYDPTKPLVSTTGSQQGSSSSSSSIAQSGTNGTKAKHPKKNVRLAGGTVWEDPTLADWPDNDFRLFCGDLGNEVGDEVLAHSFSRYATFQRARVVRDKHSHKSRGYGFVSFSDPLECVKALREMNGKYIGNRPVKLTKSRWQDRNIDVAKKKLKKKSRHLFT